MRPDISASTTGAPESLSPLPERLWTIGHSTHSPAEFRAELAAYGIETIADVRRFPASRRYPHFNSAEMAAWLAQAGVEYIHLGELGGRRPARRNSPHTAWRNASFRGYADYMDTAPFRDGLARLAATARSRRTAIMCAEAVWWRCHRSLIADYLKARGVAVVHILSTSQSQPHPYTSAACIVDGTLSYRAEQPQPALPLG